MKASSFVSSDFLRIVGIAVALAVLMSSPVLAGANLQGTNTPSPYVPAGYTEGWRDEFNEKNLDTSKWWTRIIYDGGWVDHLNDEQQRYRENNNHVMTGT